MTYRLLDVEDPMWNRVLARAPHDVYHRPEYVAMSAPSNGERAVAFLYEAHGSQVLVPLVFRKVPDHLQVAGLTLWDATSPYGYPGPIVVCGDSRDPELVVHEAFVAFCEALRKERVIAAFVRLHPHLDVPLEPLKSAGTLLCQGKTVTIDLSESEEGLWSQTRHNHRRGINKARRAGATVVVDDEWESLDYMVTLYHETMDRQGAAPFYYFDGSYFSELRSALGSAISLLTVRLGDRLVSAGLFTECCGIVQYHLSGTASEFLALQPLKLLIHEARLWAKRRGNRWMHLGGGLGAAHDSLFEFKAGFSPHRRDFHTWRVVTDPDAYSSLADRWEKLSGRSADSVTGFFPAYRKSLAGASGGIGRT